MRARTGARTAAPHTENRGRTDFPTGRSRSTRDSSRVVERVRRRAQREHIQHDGLAVALPAVVQKSAFGFPAVADRRAAVLRPPPVDAAIQRIGEFAQLDFVRRVRGEVHALRSARRRSAARCRSSTAPSARRARRSACRGSGSRNPCSRWPPDCRSDRCRGRSAARRGCRPTASARAIQPRSTATG